MEENYLGFVAIHNIRGVAFFGGTSKQFVKVFSTKIFFHQFTEVFSHESFSLYSMQ